MAMAQAKGTRPKDSDPQDSGLSDGSPAGGTPRSDSAGARSEGAGSVGGGSAGTDSAGMGYEEARAALADVVAALESGDATLEEALALWEQGERYAVVCEAWLAGAQERLSKEDRSAPEE